MSDKVLFSLLEDEKLVDVVSKYPCLYDTSSLLFKDQLAKENAWKETAELVERTAQDCKKRWRNIKDTYLKRKKKGKSTGSIASKTAKSWPLADMQFLDQITENRTSTSNLFPSDDDKSHADIKGAELNQPDDVDLPQTCDETSFVEEATKNVDSRLSPEPPTKRARTKNDKILALLETRRAEREKIINKLCKGTEDDVDLFFKSIAMSVKKLRPDFINQAKLRSLQMLFELESTNSRHLQIQSSAGGSSNTCLRITRPDLRPFRRAVILRRISTPVSSTMQGEIHEE